MLIEEALKAHLDSHAGLTALVGDRIHMVSLPQGSALPAVAFFRVSGPREVSHSGASGLARPRFQFTCWAADPLTAVRVREQVRLALIGFRGLLGGEIQASIPEVMDQADGLIGETGQYQAVLDAVIWHGEAVPA